MEKTVFSLQISRPACTPIRTPVSIYPAKTKLQNTLFHRPTCFNLRVAGLHGPFSPRTPSTFFYDVSCFSVIKHTDLSSGGILFIISIYPHKGFPRFRPDVSSKKGARACVSCVSRFNVRSAIENC